jgi:hypothetical protein
MKSIETTQGKPPVVILGMHRSGSSMLARCLENLGMFMGESKDKNAESEFFQIMNRWIFWQVNATWDNPFCFRFVNDFLRDAIVRSLELRVASPDRQIFLGFDKASRFADLRKLDFPWGWKDPRTAFTIELWTKVFPGMRVIHIYRNPVDVAASLRDRALQHKEAMSALIAAKGLAPLLVGNVQFQPSTRVENLDEGVKLWEEYTEKAIAVCTAFGDGALSVQYEHLLEHPLEVLAGIAGFAGLNVGTDQIEEQARTINSSRKFAFLDRPELMSLYERVRGRPVVERMGYGAIHSL